MILEVACREGTGNSFQKASARVVYNRPSPATLGGEDTQSTFLERDESSASATTVVAPARALHTQHRPVGTLLRNPLCTLVYSLNYALKQLCGNTRQSTPCYFLRQQNNVDNT